MSAACVLHRWSDSRVCQPGFGNTVFRRERKEMAGLLDSCRLGGILAVCSCTILPLFTSIYKRGAGLGPAIAFLYSGPAISVLSIILTARILGMEMGIARVVGAVSFSIVIGLVMAFIFRKEEQAKHEQQMNIVLPPEERPAWQTAFLFFTLVLILVFANWGAPASAEDEGWHSVFTYKWHVVGGLSLLLCWSLIKFPKTESSMGAAWNVGYSGIGRLFEVACRRRKICTSLSR